MKRIVRFLFMSSVLIALLITSHQYAGAQEDTTYDFTFSVPVELKNLPPQFVEGDLLIQVLEGKPGFDQGTIGGDVIGEGGGRFPITPGETLDTVITAGLNADPYKQAGNATFYYIQLNLRTLPNPPIDPGGETDAATATRLDGPYPYDPSEPYVTWTWDYLPGHGGPKQVRLHLPVKPLDVFGKEGTRSKSSRDPAKVKVDE